MPLLTMTAVAALRASEDGREYFIWDTDPKTYGFGVRVRASGAKSYIYRYKQGNRTKRFTIGTVEGRTLTQAREAAKRAAENVAQGRDPGEEKKARRLAPTVSALIERYLEEGPAAKPNKKAVSWASDRSVLTRHAKPLIGTKMADAVTKANIIAMQADIANGKTAVDERTRKRGRAIVKGGRTVAALTVQTLAAVYAWGNEHAYVKENPCKGVERYATGRRERFLSDVEIAAIAEGLTVCEAVERTVNTQMADAIRMLMLTGCRKNEIARLRWTEVDMERGVLRLADTKTGARVVVLSSPALAILARREPEREGEWVFPGGRGAGPIVCLRKAWLTARDKGEALALERGEKMGLSDVRLHDLRHTHASISVASGASLYLTGKLLGHRKTSTTERYAHLHDTPLRAVAESTAQRIEAAMNGERPSAEIIPIAAGRK